MVHETSDPLVSVIYVSSGIHLFSDTEIVQILTQARTNNERCGLTGMLLYRDGNFLQVLEGPRPALEATFGRIKLDPRHRGILQMKKNPIAARAFAEWQMAFRDISNESLTAIKGYSPFMELSFGDELFRSKPDVAHRMLLQFKENLR
jgi:hypothetical protein